MKLIERLKLAKMVLLEKEWSHDEIFVQKYGDLERVDRVAFLESIAGGKRVIHFGFLDSPFLEQKIASGGMLHVRLRRVAESLFGVDVNRSDLEVYRRVTGDQANVISDISAADFRIDDYPTEPQDYVFFPEVLEHIGNPKQALMNLHSLCSRTGAELVITVPNAFSLGGVTSAATGDEVVHPDHYFYFSPYTISNLARSCGFSVGKVLMYRGAPKDYRPGLTAPGVICICKA